MEKTEMMREEIKRRIHDVENELKALKELVDSEAFAPKEPELTLFEQHLLVYFQKVYYAHCESQDVNDFLIGTIKQCSKTLLELAKKEICKGCTVGLDQYWKGYEDAKERFEKRKTFYYPMYEPPCVLGGICADHIRDCINCSKTTGDIGISTTSGTCKKEE